VYVFLECGKQHFWEATFEIMSPHHPDNYEDNLECFYYIHNPFNHLLTITFQTFVVEYDTGCDDYDYLMVGILLHLCLDRRFLLTWVYMYFVLFTNSFHE